jgi:hypothetical protein
MDASKKEIADKLVNSNTLGLREMAGTIMSELEKNEKVREVVVRVRVVRLPKGQKNNNNNKQAKCKAKVSTLSYKFNVNQKNLHKLLLKRRQQLLTCSTKNTATKLPGTNNATATSAAAAAGTSSSVLMTQNTVAFQRTIVNKEQQETNNNEWCHDVSFPDSTADLNLSTSSPLSTTTFSAFSSPRDRSSFYGNIMSPVSPHHENSPSSAPLQNQCPNAVTGNFDISCSNTFYRYDCGEDTWVQSNIVTERSIPSYSSTWASITGDQMQQGEEQLNQQNQRNPLNSTRASTNCEMAHLPSSLIDFNRHSYPIPFASSTQKSQEEGKKKQKLDPDTSH